MMMLMVMVTLMVAMRCYLDEPPPFGYFVTKPYIDLTQKYSFSTPGDLSFFMDTVISKFVNALKPDMVILEEP
eukprot:240450-Karenia_brevis.AAC.1